MYKKEIKRDRIRKIPRQFSWIDQRFIRERYISLCYTESIALYMFLIIVGDAKGLSYYSDKAIIEMLSINKIELEKARSKLIEIDLLAYKKPIYQVLEIPNKNKILNFKENRGGILSVKEILKEIGGKL